MELITFTIELEFNEKCMVFNRTITRTGTSTGNLTGTICNEFEYIEKIKNCFEKYNLTSRCGLVHTFIVNYKNINEFLNYFKGFYKTIFISKLEFAKSLVN